MEIDVIGQSGEGRYIKIVKINANDTRLPTIFIDAGIHAREWISPASTLYLIEKLAKQINKVSKNILIYSGFKSQTIYCFYLFSVMPTVMCS